MRSSRLLKMLILGLSAVATVEAQMGLRVPQHGGVEKRQTGGDTANTASSSSSSSPLPPTTSSSSSSSSSTPTRSSSSSRSSSSAGATPTSPTPTPTSSSPGPTTTPSDRSTSGTIETITSVVTTTDGNGLPTTFTTATTSTSTPGLAGNTGGQPSGMSPQTKNIVIGVVVGVGGAIILGALAVVAWRIWGRKKQAEDNDDLMTYPSSAGEKPDTGNSTSNRTPFQSTLESYHAPTQVNPASNF